MFLPETRGGQSRQGTGTCRRHPSRTGLPVVLPATSAHCGSLLWLAPITVWKGGKILVKGNYLGGHGRGRTWGRERRETEYEGEPHWCTWTLKSSFTCSDLPQGVTGHADICCFTSSLSLCVGVVGAQELIPQGLQCAVWTKDQNILVVRASRELRQVAERWEFLDSEECVYRGAQNKLWFMPHGSWMKFYPGKWAISSKEHSLLCSPPLLLYFSQLSEMAGRR